jgi:hypothetical protein
LPKHCVNLECPALERDGVPAEYLDTLSTCSECGAELDDRPRPDTVAQVEYVDLVTIYVSVDPTSAHLLRGLLEAEEIPVVVLGEMLGGAFGELPANVLQLPIQVPAEFASRAREVALEFESARRTGV